MRHAVSLLLLAVYASANWACDRSALDQPAPPSPTVSEGADGDAGAAPSCDPDGPASIDHLSTTGRIATGDFNLIGLSPQATYVAVLTLGVPHALRIYDATPRFLATADCQVSYANLHGTSTIYYSKVNSSSAIDESPPSTSLRAWWPARGTTGGWTIEEVEGKLDLVVSSSGELFATESPSYALTSGVIHFGHLGGPVETLTGDRGIFSPMTEHFY